MSNIIFDGNNEGYTIEDSLMNSNGLKTIKNDGYYFNKAYNQFPVCGPSRASFLTGLYADQSKNYNFHQKVDSLMTIPKYFKNKGYNVSSFGKVFHRPTIGPFDVYSDHYSPEQSMMYYDYNANGQCRKRAIYCNFPLLKMTDYKMTSNVVNYINNYDSNKPWFIAVGFTRPHVSNAVDRKFYHKSNVYINTTMIFSKTNLNYYNCDDVYKSKMLFKGKLQTMISKQRKESSDISSKFYNDALEFIRYYQAAVLFVDSQIARIINTLKNNNQYDNTIIIFTSDHGWNSGHYGFWCKNTLIENTANVPLLIKFQKNFNRKLFNKDFDKGSTINIPVNLVNIFPTLLDSLNFTIPQNLDKSLMNPNYEEFAFTQYPRCYSYGTIQGTDCMFKENDPCNLPEIKYMGYSVRHSKYTYILWKPYKSIRNCINKYNTKIPLDEGYTEWNKNSLDTVLMENGIIIKNIVLQNYYESIIKNKFSPFS